MSESQTLNFVLYEHAVGYTLFAVTESKEPKEVQAAVMDVELFASIVQVHSFEPFKDGDSALENANCVAEGILHDDLLNFLEGNLPKKRKKVLLGVSDRKIGSAITEQLGVRCAFTGVILQIIRGIRVHLEHFVKDLATQLLSNAALSLAHSYSRDKVQFDPERDDSMVVQAISLIDDIDREVNNYVMRCREWYGWHFPELGKLLTDAITYVKVVKTMGLKENARQAGLSLLVSDEMAEKICETADLSMGSDVSLVDQLHISLLCDQILELSAYRTELHDYLKKRMHALAPNLTGLVGEVIAARLVSRAGSLERLAKCPSSTVQLLGAEKALFRALKKKQATPKYGIIYHASLVTHASGRDKARMARKLAAKVSLVARYDAFHDRNELGETQPPDVMIQLGAATLLAEK